MQALATLTTGAASQRRQPGSEFLFWILVDDVTCTD